MIPELSAFFHNKLNIGGTMMVHDIDALNVQELLRRMGNPKYQETQDHKRRKMGTFIKA